MVPEGGREADPMRSLLILTAFAVMLAGPRGSFAANFDEDTFGRKSIPAYSIPTPERGAPPAETVIGQVRPYRIRKGDTLIDLARYYDLGYNEIVVAGEVDQRPRPLLRPRLQRNRRREPRDRPVGAAGGRDHPAA